MGIGAIPALVFGPSLAGSLGTLFTSLSLTGIAAGFVGAFSGIATAVGFIVRQVRQSSINISKSITTKDNSTISAPEESNNKNFEPSNKLYSHPKLGKPPLNSTDNIEGDPYPGQTIKSASEVSRETLDENSEISEYRASLQFINI